MTNKKFESDLKKLKKKRKFDKLIQSQCALLDKLIRKLLIIDAENTISFNSNKVNTAMKILNYIKGLEFFPNVYITYRISLIISVTIIILERSSLKLKLFKEYKINNVTI